MKKQFFNVFDEETKLKLRIFRLYLREWLPVFLQSRNTDCVMICDYFCGEGADSSGTVGSPLIIADEVSQYLNNAQLIRNWKAKIDIRLNDKDWRRIEKLKVNLKSKNFAAERHVQFRSEDFVSALESDIEQLQDKRVASLLFIDQFGLKHVTNEVFRKLVSLPKTDVLFFVSSSHIRRFITLQAVRKYVPIEVSRIKGVPNDQIHRFICTEYYKGLISPEAEYYVTPFSIKGRGRSNVYGLVFGSSSLRGAEKFLNVCWDVDGHAGEGNYSLDKDMFFDQGELPFPPTTARKDRFETELLNFMRGGANNKSLYRFSIGNGFPPKQVGIILRSWQDSGVLKVVRCSSGDKVRKGTFYLSYQYYQRPPMVRFLIRDH